MSSGTECAAALRSEGFDVTELDAGPDVAERLLDLKPDVVFNALHGRWGEDGCVQGLLEWLRIPYTHSGVLASALAMDKQRSKSIYMNAGLPVVESMICPKDKVKSGHMMIPPYVVKPNNEGSSVGVYLVHEMSNAPPQLSDEMPEMVMVEAYVPGRELTTTVMGDRALTVTDIFTDGWYDYDAKYKPGGSRHQIPADVPKPIFDLCMDYALRAHQVLGCRGLSRTDFRWNEELGMEGLFLLETNTQPGMTPLSLVPEQARLIGMDYADIVEAIVASALPEDAR